MGALAASLLATPLFAAETMQPPNRQKFDAYMDCLFNAASVLGEKSKDSAEAVVQATYGACYEQEVDLRNNARAMNGPEYAAAYMKVFVKNITPQLMFRVISQRTK